VGLYLTHLITSRMEYENSSFYLHQFVKDCQERIAQRYACPVWLVHPIQTRLEGRPATAKLSPSDARDCRTFGDHLDICVNLGARASQFNCFLIQTTKTPRNSRVLRPKVLCIDRDFATIRESQVYCLNTSGSRIVRIQRIQRTRSRGGIEDGSPAQAESLPPYD
jgi:hypothetical protein